ncbi:putative secreted protein [Sorangium cellulosum So ce56]|uniref:Secreted protein n=1 Tax=Sorangium cellulosum (strain So ce56) TaxID=448385 RepID=A9GBS8_SORC5|nr:hypothetical protein [Sorangium cellulosum]CAN96085.1 putative secreted protein [Sorangium cellulosum So ce56]
MTTSPPAPRRRARHLVGTGRLLLLLASLPACAASAPRRGGALDAELARLLPGPSAGTSAARLDPSAWREGRERLAGLRREVEGAGPRTLRVRLALREPRTGHVLEARGAIAVAPPAIEGRARAAGSDILEPEGALRMILLGPGGTTALDLWARGDRFRFAVPALDLLRRGDASTPRTALRGLPVDFLRWWMLHPAAGTLLWYSRAESTDSFVLRDGDAVIDLRVNDRGVIGARRTTWSTAEGARRRRLDEEVVIAEGMGCGNVRYAQASTGLLITVICEAEERDRAPDPRAFVDPDALRQGGGS